MAGYENLNDGAVAHDGVEEKALGHDVTVRPVEEWAEHLEVPDWKLAAAKTLAKCPVGRELDRDGFEKMIADVDSVVCR